MATGLKYGHLTGDGHGVRYALTNGEYFNEKGGHFVKMGSSGAVSLSTDSTSDYLIGWAETGKLYGYGANYFLADTESDALVILAGQDDTYRVPAQHAVTAAMKGIKYHVVTTGSTTSLIQQVENHLVGVIKYTAQVLVVDVDAIDIANQTMQVKLLSAKAAS